MDELNKIILDFENITGKTLFKNNDTQRVVLNKNYIYVPVVVLALLVLFKPPFLYIKTEDNKDVFSFKKLIIFSIIISTCIDIAYYLYLHQDFLENWKFLAM